MAWGVGIRQGPRLRPTCLSDTGDMHGEILLLLILFAFRISHSHVFTTVPGDPSQLPR